MNELHSGFVAILGKPNVGKSTLVNAFLGQKIAAVSPRPQTTRHRQLGILTLPQAQIVFVDTPGVHIPRHKLGQFFNQEAKEALEGVDVDLFLVDASTEPDDEDRQVARLLLDQKHRPDLFLGLNKIDLVPPSDREARPVRVSGRGPGGHGVPALSLPRRRPRRPAGGAGRLSAHPPAGISCRADHGST